MNTDLLKKSKKMRSIKCNKNLKFEYGSIKN